MEALARVWRAFFLAFVVGPVARLMIRVMAWRLIVRRASPYQFSRNKALATAAKALGRCDACGSYGTLEADHYRPLWAGGADSAENIQPLCKRCHDVKSGTETKVRAWVRRIRHGHGSGAPNPLGLMPMHRWVLFGLLGLGLLDGTFDLIPWWPWRACVVILFGFGLWWQHRHRTRLSGEDGMVRFDADDERKRYADSTLGDHVRATQAIKVAKAKTRATIIWHPGAYLLGLAVALFAL